DRRPARLHRIGSGRWCRHLPIVGAAVRGRVRTAAGSPRRRDRPRSQAGPCAGRGRLMHLVYPLVVASLLFGIGVYGVLARRNAVLVLMSVELMLNAVNLNLVAFDAWWRDTAFHSGQVFALFVIVIAAA